MTYFTFTFMLSFLVLSYPIFQVTVFHQNFLCILAVLLVVLHPSVKHTHRPAVLMLYMAIVDTIVISRLAVQIKQSVSLIFIIKWSSVGRLLTPSFCSFLSSFGAPLTVSNFSIVVCKWQHIYETIGNAEAYLHKVDFTWVHLNWTKWWVMFV